MTFTEWPIITWGAKWGGRAIVYARKGAAMAGKVATLEARVTALEELLSKQPADACPKCGERAVRRTSAGRMWGEGRGAHREDFYQCEKCGDQETRTVLFSKERNHG